MDSDPKIAIRTPNHLGVTTYQSERKHCWYLCRVNSCTALLLSQAMFNLAENMAVTGHTAVSPLAVYQRVNDSENIAIRKAIANSIEQNEEFLILLDENDNIFIKCRS